MIHGGPGVVSCDWTTHYTPENLEFSLNLCLVLKQYITLEQYSTSLLFLLPSFVYYFRKYNGNYRNCLYAGDRPTPSPRTNDHGRVQAQRERPPRENGRRERLIKDNVIIVENVGIWPTCALLNIKLQ